MVTKSGPFANSKSNGWFAAFADFQSKVAGYNTLIAYFHNLDMVFTDANANPDDPNNPGFERFEFITVHDDGSSHIIVDYLG